MATKVIVVGGGLAGLSAAHTILQSGGNVLMLDRNAFLGGNSTKATSGINGTLTKTQIKKGIPDSPEVFYEDSAKAARDRIRPPLVKVLTHESGPAVDWLQDRFGLDLSLVARLGGHSFPRTHRGQGGQFPGMEITYALMTKLEEICKNEPARARLINKARVIRLIKSGEEVVGVEYEKNGKNSIEYGPVIIASGGFGADFSPDSLLAKYRPELIKMNLATTNGAHCSGDGIKMAEAIGASSVDMEKVQVHPTGLVDLKDPDSKIKFLAAEALRGVGGILLDANGKRFCDELGHRDYVTGEMWKNKGPFRLILNSTAASEIEWHVKHYTGRGLMKGFKSGADLAAEMGISPDVLKSTFDAYNEAAAAKKDAYGKKFYAAVPFKLDDSFAVSIVCPVIHYTMGGLEINHHAEVISKAGAPIKGLYGAGEVVGGIHGANRLGGSSLLDCVVFGRVAGATASRQLLQRALAGGIAGKSTVGGAGVTRVEVIPGSKKVSVEISWDDKGAATVAGAASAPAPAGAGGSDSAAPPPEGVDNWDDPETGKKGFSSNAFGGSTPAAGASAAPAVAGAKKEMKEYTLEEVAKHNTKEDLWVIVNGQVLDVTKFLPDHPGGANAILLFAGRDATAEFNMLHKADVVEKYAPESIIGTVKGAAKKEIKAKL